MSNPSVDLEEAVADDGGELRRYGVPEGSISVHLAGNPISHSVHSGFLRPLFPLTSHCASRSVSVPSAMRLLMMFLAPVAPQLLAVGAGHNEHAGPCVWRTHFAAA
jgi:hypothetical protein